MLLPSGNPIKCHEEVLSSQPMFPPTTRFDNFPPDWVNAQNDDGLDAFIILFQTSVTRRLTINIVKTICLDVGACLKVNTRALGRFRLAQEG